MCMDLSLGCLPIVFSLCYVYSPISFLCYAYSPISFLYYVYSPISSLHRMYLKYLCSEHIPNSLCNTIAFCFLSALLHYSVISLNHHQHILNLHNTYTLVSLPFSSHSPPIRFFSALTWP